MKYKKVIAAGLALCMTASLCACGGKHSAPVFSDISDSDWCAPFVREAAESGITLGYEDGTYQPSKYITAGEFVTMLAKGNGADPEKFEARHWSFVYWQYLDKYGVFDKSRVSDLRTSLNAGITRQEAALLIYNAMVDMLGEEIVPTNNPAANIPGYIALDPQYLLPVAELYAKGILAGYENLEFYGSEKLTRGEAAAMIVCLYDKSKRNVASPGKSSAYAADKIFGSDTLFIGDSLTYQFIENYLMPNGMIGEASYMAAPRTTVKYFLASYWVLTPSEDNRYGVACNDEFQDLSFRDALAVNPGKYKTVFFMLGSSNSAYVTRNQFVNAVEMILKYDPDAAIYVQTIPNSPNGAVQAERVNGIIRDAAETLADEGCSSVYVLDTNSAWNTACIAKDGMHLTTMGLDAWYRYICANAEFQN